MNNLEKEFVPYQEALELKELGFDEPCFGWYQSCRLKIETHPLNLSNQTYMKGEDCFAPTFSQAINFLYICSNKQINIELKASDTYEERVRKVVQGCEDLRNLQNSKSN